MATYSIDDGNSDLLCAGLQEHNARAVAQQLANERRESVWLYRASDGAQAYESEEIKPLTVHAVLAGAYRGRRAKLDALLTHASTDGGSTAVCGNVAEGNLCDVIESGPPSCKKCAKKYA